MSPFLVTEKGLPLFSSLPRIVSDIWEKTVPLDEEITKQVLAGIINVSKEDPNTFEVYDTPAKSTEKKAEKKTAKK